MTDVIEPDAPAPARRRRADPVPLLFGLGLAVLAGGAAWLYWHPDLLAEAGPSLAERVASLEQRAGRLEARPVAPQPQALRAIESQLAALERARLPAPETPAPNPPPAAPIDRAADQAADQAAEARVAALADRVRAMQAALATQTAALGQQLAAARRMAALQGTAAELAAGHRLDLLPALPDAPEALRRFADAAPPTTASLQAGFAEAARAARAAGGPDEESFAGRLRHAAGRLVTIRRGDAVVLGDAADAPLQRAEARLDANDPAGAAAALAPLRGGAAGAMAAWRSRAEALAAARDALATLLAQPPVPAAPADGPAP